MKKSRLLSAVFLILVLPATWVSAFSFTPLGGLPYGSELYSTAWDVSGDGSVATGGSRITRNIGGGAFYWTLSSGITNLGSLSNGYSSFGHAISTDGKTIVGQYDTSLGTEAFRWTSSEGYVGLGEFAGGQYYSAAHGVSGNGDHIVGYSNHSMTEAFLWTQANGMQGLGDLPGGLAYSIANGVSDDGSVIIGKSISTIGSEAFRWTNSTGMTSINAGPGSQALSVSNDGQTIVGNTDTGGVSEAFMWTEQRGVIRLGTFSNYGTSSAFDVSANGSIVVGTSDKLLASGSVLTRASLWNSSGNIVDIQEILASNGIDLTDWNLTQARGVSADGSIIVGFGTNPNGYTEAWIADLTAVPIPPALWLFGSGLLGLIGIARKKTT